MSNRIYLDYAATTPVDPAVLKAMKPYFLKHFGNASSLHSYGQEAMKAVDQARDKVAQFLGARADEIIFTSGATESNNLVLRGTVKNIKYQISNIKNYNSWQAQGALHIITSAIEHPAVLETCKDLEKEEIEVSYLSPNKEGLIPLEKVKEAIKENTILVSIMYVNNEIGTIQPISEIGQILEGINNHRQKENLSKILFHTDAVQAANYLSCKVKELKVDFLTLSGHKIYGPKGIGALYVKKGADISPIQTGGQHHEYGLRAGTLNVPGIVGIGKAVELIGDQKEKLRIQSLRDRIIKKVLQEIPQVTINGSFKKRVPNNIHLSFEGLEGESLMLALDLEGIATSTGSACASGSLEPSHVLLAIGLSHERAHGSLRITLGKQTAKKEVDRLLEVLPAVVARLRKIAPKNSK